MNIIKYILAKLAAKITGRKCCHCAHNGNGRCYHYDKRMFSDCWLSITRPGFHHRALHGLTPEEKRQLHKIVSTMDEAAEMTRESGLLTED